MTATVSLSRSLPEPHGVDSVKLLEFVEAVDAQIHSLHSLMLVRHGAVVAEGWWQPFTPQAPHVLFSLSKSFTSTGIGLAVEEGLLSLDDPVISFFPNDAPKNISDNLAAMRVRHLLGMSTGHAQDAFGPLTRRRMKNWAKAILSLPVEHQPGTVFVYNSGASYLLSAIIQKVTGMTLLEYLTPRLLEPLGIIDATWETCPRGINTGGWGLKIRTEEIARFGQLYLQKGMWQGRRILSEAWVEEATASHISNGSDPNSDWAQGYGYQFWRCRHNCYRGDGAFGQYCVVMPEQDAVLAVTAGIADMQPFLDLVWQHLLPALHAAPLATNPDAQQKLSAKLAALAIQPPQGEATSPLAEDLSGNEFTFQTKRMGISRVRFDFAAPTPSVTLFTKDAAHTLLFSAGGWQPQHTALVPWLASPAAVNGCWTAKDTFTLTAWFTETPFSFTLRFQFKPGKVIFTLQQNVSFGKTNFRPVEGKPAA